MCAVRQLFFFLASLAWNFGLGMSWLAIPLYAHSQGLSNAEIGALFAAPVFAQVPLNLAGGQLLVKPNSSWIFNLSQATSGLDVYTIPVPNDPALIGATIFTQALIFGGGYELCNATDLVLGN